MSLIAKLFSKTPNAMDIRLHLKELERDQHKKRRDMDLLEQTKQQLVQQAVAAKKAGRQELVLDIFRQIRQIEIDNGNAHSDLRRLSLSKIALTSFLRRVDMLEKKKDHKSLQSLVAKFRNSDLQRTIDIAEVDDDALHNMMTGILGEEEELAGSQEKLQEDPGFAEFDRAIEGMAKTEGVDGYPAAHRSGNGAANAPRSSSGSLTTARTVNTCGVCDGVGQVGDGSGSYRPCPNCGGTGTIDDDKCNLCGGTGTIKCPRCGGSGGGGTCFMCGGKGTTNCPKGC
jgi:hypothetical protein